MIRMMKNLIFGVLLATLMAAAVHSQNTADETKPETPVRGISYNGPAWSFDSKWIAFSRMDITDSKPVKIDADVYVVASDGTGLRKVTGSGTNEFDPVFSKNARSLFFSVNEEKSGVANIFTSNIDGSGKRQLTTNIHHASAPQLSPDGKWVVLNGNLTADPDDHHPQIFVIRSDGSDVKKLTNDGSLAYYDPVWSPDGKRLVYYVERGDRKDQIWSMKADGTDQKLLTNNIGHNFYPSWTADGKRILFTSNRDGKQQLYSMNPDGSDVRSLGIESFYARQSPDGKKLVYVGGQWPNMRLYVSNVDGSNAVKLVD